MVSTVFVWVSPRWISTNGGCPREKWLVLDLRHDPVDRLIEDRVYSTQIPGLWKMSLVIYGGFEILRLFMCGHFWVFGFEPAPLLFSFGHLPPTQIAQFRT